MDTVSLLAQVGRLSKVVAAVGEERLPDLVGLCEVENDSVLFDLTRRFVLRALGYRYVATHSPDCAGHRRGPALPAG